MADSFEEATEMRKRKAPDELNRQYGNEGGGKSSGKCSLCGESYEHGLAKHIRKSCAGSAQNRSDSK